MKELEIDAGNYDIVAGTDCFQGLRMHEIQEKQKYSFEEIERFYYQQNYGDYVEAQKLVDRFR